MKQLLVFVLTAGLLCWMMFSAAYKHVAIARQALLQKEVDYLLEIGANGSHGYIHDAMIAQSKSRLEERGFDTSRLTYEVTTTSGLPGHLRDQPVPRGTGLLLTIRYPYGDLFAIDRLIGMTPPDPELQMAATGIKMSEYVP
ncbi:hypothetical protein DUZ99_01525 [Xylanibacillus composti]|uniref:Uncharacterized protein n=1 Tax=Xylanibacillus composti TaxID=1572762 RepID=A0A8J4M4D5_9BACL|nr:hypothetical protein [Xylanibacillus composti]MDT9723678.1 hypothetical protein [Xylanibacillus composti]GIQ71015.1 hypothetical protein XYCOK13_38390 [Xylanibacillus composti]